MRFCDFDFETEAIGTDKNGVDVFLKDIWPTPVTNKIIYALNSKQKIDKANNAIQLRDDA